MDYKNLFNYIYNEIIYGEKLIENCVFSDLVLDTVSDSLKSLYFILRKTFSYYDECLEKYMKEALLPLNQSIIKPSDSEICGMCYMHSRLVYEDDQKYVISHMLLTLMIIRCRLSQETSEKENLSIEEIWEESLTRLCNVFRIPNNMNENYNQTRIVLSALYVYFYFILDRANLIQNKINFWCPNSIDNLIYLPLVGVVNLGYFQYLISPCKNMFCKEVIFDKEADESGFFIRSRKDEIISNDITQFDCGYIDSSNKNTKLKFYELVEMISVLKDWNDLADGEVFDFNNYKNLLEISNDWLKLFHIFTVDSKDNNAKIKLKKVIYDTSCYFAGKNEFPNKKFTCCRILGKNDECNFMVGGIMYPNLYGTVTTCIKSIIFRELNLRTIYHLENIHETVMSHLGVFSSTIKSMLVDEDLNEETKKTLFESIKKKVEEYTLTCIIDNADLRDNALIQMVSWQFISEIYSHLKVEVVVCEYLKNNDDVIRNPYGYLPENVPVEYEVFLDRLEVKYPKAIVCNEKGNFTIKYQYQIVSNILEYFYTNQPVFKHNDIKNLIDDTKATILKFFGDTHLKQFEKHCSLRQFMTVSLILVKKQKGKDGLANVPEFKYYNSQKRSLSVRTLLTNTNINSTLKDIAFASKLMEYQNHMFIKTSHLDWYNDIAILSYQKIINFFEEKIPILKTGEKSKSARDDASLEERITPYDLLIFAYDTTVNLFDKLLDDLLE